MYENYSVEVIPLTDIDKGKRYREDYRDVHVLARGIEQKGLISPIAVYKKPDSDGGPPYLLLAGGRRLKAHEVLKRTEIPCRIYDHELTDLEIRSIELEENLNREDLSYDEEVRLKQRIHELQVEIYGPKVSTAPGAKGHSLTDTAALLNVTPASLSQDMKIARAMEQFPDLQWDRIKNKSDAFKLVKSIENSIGRMECAKLAEETIGTGDVKKKKLYDSFVVGDFFKKIEETPDKYFDVVELDPPYAIRLQDVKKGYNYEGYNEVPVDEYPTFMDRVLKACFRKMSDNSWLICWYGLEWHHTIMQLILKNGFSTTPLVGIWAKGTGQTHMPQSRLANSYETFFYAWKGSPCLGKPGSTNLFTFRPVPPGKKVHPTERPLDLMTDILVTFGIENCRVLVPFAGSGNTLIASVMSKMIPLGFDLTQAYKDSYVLRVNELF